MSTRSPIVSEPDGSPEPPPRPARDVLKEYWGAQWPEVEQRLKDKGEDLSVPFELVPWETAALTLEPLALLNDEERGTLYRTVLHWPVDSEPTELAAWLASEFNVNDPPSIELADVFAIEDLARPYNDELSLLAEEWTNGIDRLMRERWNSGQFQKAPFSSRGQATEFGFFSKAIGAASWAVVFTLKREDCPDMVDIESRGDGARNRRAHAVEQFLKARGYR